MASAWVEKRRTRGGQLRYRVEYRLGGAGTRSRYAGQFKTKREALARRSFVTGELAALRVPDLSQLQEAPLAPTLAESAASWQASRVDVAESTKVQHRTALGRVLPVLGERRLDSLTAHDMADLVALLHEAGKARESIRKTLTALAMVFDYAGVQPNPARDRVVVKLPREEPEEPNPPIAAHVEAVYWLLPSKHRLALLFLDCSGMRVTAGIDLPLVSDYDEQRRRVRLRAATTKTRRALWVQLPDVLAEALEESLGPREDRDPEARLFAGSGGDALRTAIAKACRAAAVPLWSPHDLRHRRISLLHAQGMSWARVAELVGQRDLNVTANTYTHVLADETELDYAALLAAAATEDSALVA